MRSPEHIGPHNEYLVSPSSRVDAIRKDVAQARGTQTFYSMYNAAKNASAESMNRILDADRKTLESPLTGVPLGFNYAVRTLDRLTLYGAQAEFPAGHSMARHMSDTLAECLTPPHKFFADYEKLEDWLSKVSRTLARDNKANPRLELISQAFQISPVNELPLPLPAWLDPRFTNPQT
ncbi:MAG: hypothetical protein KA035_01690 [Candidatus Levybacteria bacterium]|nr:hypothetical protein [Candidatus Levybacteria bacterium]